LVTLPHMKELLKRKWINIGITSHLSKEGNPISFLTNAIVSVFS
jgi:hypothetical protein